MKEWVRRLRGAIGMGLSWALAWAPLGALLGAGLFLTLPELPAGASLLRGMLRNGATLGVLGFLGGVYFSGVLRLAEGSSRFDQLSAPRFALWGALGGVTLGGLGAALGLWGAGIGGFGHVLVGVATLLGASSAVATLAVARAADDADLLEQGEEVSDVGLSPEEARRLLSS